MGKNIYDKTTIKSLNYDMPSERTSNIYDRIEILRDSSSTLVSTVPDFQKPISYEQKTTNKTPCLKLIKNRKFIMALVSSLIIAFIAICLVVFLVVFLNGISNKIFFFNLKIIKSWNIIF